MIVLTSFGDDEKLLPAVRAGRPATCSSRPRRRRSCARSAPRTTATRYRPEDRRPPARGARPPPGGRAQPLTPRERDVLTCVCRGMSNKRSPASSASRRRPSRRTSATSSRSSASPTGRRRRCSGCARGSPTADRTRAERQDQLAPGRLARAPPGRTVSREDRNRDRSFPRPGACSRA